MEEKTYTLPNGSEVKISEIDALESDIQSELIKHWFLSNYEDPANETPYDGREGGYQYIWGGPYNAHEEIEDEFGGIFSDEQISEVVNDLERRCYEWAPICLPDRFEDYVVNDIASISDYRKSFESALLDAQELINADIEAHSLDFLYRLLFVSVITAVEAYLSDAFIHHVKNDQSFLRRFVEKTPEFSSRKFVLANIFLEFDRLEEHVDSHLAKVVWHNFDRVAKMYESTLNIKFSENLNYMRKATLTRHDIVHRNGKTKDGAQVLVSNEDIHDLILRAAGFVETIDAQVQQLYTV